MKSRYILRRFVSLLLALLVLSAVPVAAEEEEKDIGILPDWLTGECEEPGRIEVMEYVNCYGFPLQAGVYLPYGYEEDGCYDVAFLWSGTLNGYDEALQFTYPCVFESGGVRNLSCKQLLDRMIEGKRLRPFIVVCLEDIGSENAEAAALDIGIVLEQVKETYPTYASVEGITDEELREHFFFFGFSQGAIFAESAAMVYHFDSFASYAAVSYGSWWGVAESVSESPYELRKLYAFMGGPYDHGAESTQRCYDFITRDCPEKIRDGDNALLRQSELYNHSYSLMLAAMYDFLPMMLHPLKTAKQVKAWKF